MSIQVLASASLSSCSVYSLLILVLYFLLMDILFFLIPLLYHFNINHYLMIKQKFIIVYMHTYIPTYIYIYQSNPFFYLGEKEHSS